jgi:nucleotide-binding universal stress UspA family protein
MYKRILVAVDGSNTSRRAFESALNLAGSMGAVLQPFYVVENTPMYFEAPGYDPSILRNRLIEQGKELGAEFTQAMREKGVSGEVAVAEATAVDDVATVVLKAAAAFNADLLVMGTHGRRASSGCSSAALPNAACVRLRYPFCWCLRRQDRSTTPHRLDASFCRETVDNHGGTMD